MRLLPKQPVLKTLSLFVVTVIPFTLTCGAIFWVMFHGALTTVPESNPISERFNLLFIIFLSTIISLQILFIFWLKRSLVSPLQQILEGVEEYGNAIKHKKNLPHPQKISIADDSEEWPELTKPIGRIIRQVNKENKRFQHQLERNQALLSSVPTPIIAIDDEHQILFTNEGLSRFFATESLQPEKTRLKEIIRKPELVHAFENAIAENQPQVVETTLSQREEHNNGQLSYFSVHIHPLYRINKASGNTGAIAVFNDVTEHKKAELIRTEFVANVSHELRTPLTSIQGYIKTLDEDCQQGQFELMSHYSSIIKRNTDQLISLVSELLELAKLDAGTEIDKTTIQTQEFTERVLDSLRFKSQEKQQTITSSYQSDIVLADPKRLEQILINLVSNAINYTPEGSQIEITWSRLNDDNVGLQVKDNGPGISDADQERLFERFYRVDKSRTRDLGGTGLGLAIVKHIMKSHGGEITVDSQLGHGTTFCCSFPSL